MEVKITTRPRGVTIIADSLAGIGWWLRNAQATVTVTGPGARDIVEELRAAGVDAREG